MTTAPPLRTAAAKQAAQLAYCLIGERDANRRAKLAHTLCQLLTDLDTAATMAVGLSSLAQEQERIIQAVEAAGITTIAVDTETPLELKGLGE